MSGPNFQAMADALLSPKPGFAYVPGKIPSAAAADAHQSRSKSSQTGSSDADHSSGSDLKLWHLYGRRLQQEAGESWFSASAKDWIDMLASFTDLSIDVSKAAEEQLREIIKGIESISISDMMEFALTNAARDHGVELTNKKLQTIRHHHKDIFQFFQTQQLSETVDGNDGQGPAGGLAAEPYISANPMLDGLDMHGANPTAASRGPVTQQEMEDLVNELLDDSEMAVQSAEGKGDYLIPQAEAPEPPSTPKSKPTKFSLTGWSPNPATSRRALRSSLSGSDKFSTFSPKRHAPPASSTTRSYTSAELEDYRANKARYADTLSDGVYSTAYGTNAFDPAPNPTKAWSVPKSSTASRSTTSKPSIGTSRAPVSARHFGLARSPMRVPTNADFAIETDPELVATQSAERRARFAPTLSQSTVFDHQEPAANVGLDLRLSPLAPRRPSVERDLGTYTARASPPGAWKYRDEPNSSETSFQYPRSPSASSSLFAAYPRTKYLGNFSPRTARLARAKLASLGHPVPAPAPPAQDSPPLPEPKATTDTLRRSTRPRRKTRYTPSPSPFSKPQGVKKRTALKRRTRAAAAAATAEQEFQPDPRSPTPEPSPVLRRAPKRRAANAPEAPYRPQEEPTSPASTSASTPPPRKRRKVTRSTAVGSRAQAAAEKLAREGHGAKRLSDGQSVVESVEGGGGGEDEGVSDDGLETQSHRCSSPSPERGLRQKNETARRESEERRVKSPL